MWKNTKRKISSQNYRKTRKLIANGQPREYRFVFRVSSRSENRLEFPYEIFIEISVMPKADHWPRYTSIPKCGIINCQNMKRSHETGNSLAFSVSLRPEFPPLNPLICNLPAPLPNSHSPKGEATPSPTPLNHNPLKLSAMHIGTFRHEMFAN